MKNDFAERFMCPSGRSAEKTKKLKGSFGFIVIMFTTIAQQYLCFILSMQEVNKPVC